MTTIPASPPSEGSMSEGQTTDAGQYVNEPTANLLGRVLEVAEDQERYAEARANRLDRGGQLDAYEASRDALAIREVCRRLQAAESALASRPSVGASEPQDGVALIAAERRRQVEGHGFTAERDDRYQNGELAMAATHYAMIEFDYSCHGDLFWPAEWDSRWDQKDEDDRITQLVKAGALIAAEIDRLTRAALSQEARP